MNAFFVWRFVAQLFCSWEFFWVLTIFSFAVSYLYLCKLHQNKIAYLLSIFFPHIHDFSWQKQKNLNWPIASLVSTICVLFQKKYELLLFRLSIAKPQTVSLFFCFWRINRRQKSLVSSHFCFGRSKHRKLKTENKPPLLCKKRKRKSSKVLLNTTSPI